MKFTINISIRLCVCVGGWLVWTFHRERSIVGGMDSFLAEFGFFIIAGYIMIMMIFSRTNQPLNFILRYGENVLSVTCIHDIMYVYIRQTRNRSQDLFSIQCSIIMIDLKCLHNSLWPCFPEAPTNSSRMSAWLRRPESCGSSRPGPWGT